MLEINIDPLSSKDLDLQHMTDHKSMATHRLSFRTGLLPAVGFQTYFLTVHDEHIYTKGIFT